jgi:molecular chaperone DnaK (HSP70)
MLFWEDQHDLSKMRINEGDRILVIDIGGGTIDAQHLETTSLTPNVQFRELAVGSGCIGGALLIDLAFLMFLD